MQSLSRAVAWPPLDWPPDVYEIPIGPFGRLGPAVTIPLSGPAATFSNDGLNLNGIAATADGNTLIVNNTVLDKLFTVDPVTGASAHDLSSGTITSTITSPLFDDPTTVAMYGNELALPSGRYELGLPPPFGSGAPPGTTFNVVVVPAR